MPRCKHEGCDQGVRLVADKSYDAVRWSGTSPNCFLIYLYPSKVCDSGLCNYHWLKRYLCIMYMVDCGRSENNK